MQVVKKLAEIFKLMSENPNKSRWRATEISNELNINISTTYRLLQSLTNIGFIFQDPVSKKYSLGLNLIYYAEVVREINISGSIIYPLMKKLYEAIGETIFVTQKEGERCVVIERINSHHQLRIVKQIGDSISLLEGPCGKVILAHLPNTIRKRIINNSPIKDVLQESVDTIRKNGYLREEKKEIDATIISAPVFTPEEYIIASISVAIPNCRVSDYVISNTIKHLKIVSQELIDNNIKIFI